MKLQTDGFYATGAVPWDDWHAGVHMTGESYHYWRFYSDGSWIKASRDTPGFDFWNFTESITQDVVQAARRGRAPQMTGGEQLCTAGTYIVAGDHLIATFTPELYLPGSLQWRFDDTSQGLIWHVGDVPYVLSYHPRS